MSFTPQEIPTGAVRYNTDSNKMEVYIGSTWMEVAVSSPNLDGGARGVFGGSYTYTSYAKTNIIDFITIPSAGNAIDFGDLTETRGTGGAGASRTRGMWCGGDINPDGNKTSDTVDFVTITSTGNATDFGDTSTTTRNASTGTCSNQTRGIMFVGGGPSQTNAINYITMASSSNGIDFGDLNAAVGQTGALASSVRGINFGGSPNNSTDTNRIDYITISTTGDATDFGDLTQPGRYQSGLSNSTRGVIHEADYPSAITTLTFVTTASTGNAQDFGDAITAGAVFEATGSSPTRGIFGSRGPGNLGKIEYVTIPTTGNGISFGDLVNSGGKGGGVSNGHGGL